MEHSLFQGVISYIRESKSFYIKNLISEVGYLETQTANKLMNKNPYYRTRQYISYLCRCEYLKRTGHGHYLAIKELPSNLTLTMIHQQLGYVYNRKPEKVKTPTLITKSAAAIMSNSVYGAYGVQSEDSPYEKSLNRLKDAIQTINTLKGQEKLKPVIVATQEKTEPKPGITVEKVAFEDSLFANQKPKQSIDLQEVINIGHLRSALACLDDIVTTDTVLHARILNVISILKTIDSDLHTKIKLNG